MGCATERTSSLSASRLATYSGASASSPSSQSLVRSRCGCGSPRAEEFLHTQKRWGGIAWLQCYSLVRSRCGSGSPSAETFLQPGRRGTRGYKLKNTLLRRGCGSPRAEVLHTGATDTDSHSLGGLAAHLARLPRDERMRFSCEIPASLWGLGTGCSASARVVSSALPVLVGDARTEGEPCLL